MRRQAPYGEAKVPNGQNNPNGQIQPNVQAVNAENDKKEIPDVEEELRMCKRLLDNECLQSE